MAVPMHPILRRAHIPRMVRSVPENSVKPSLALGIGEELVFSPLEQTSEGLRLSRRVLSAHFPFPLQKSRAPSLLFLFDFGRKFALSVDGRSGPLGQGFPID